MADDRFQPVVNKRSQSIACRHGQPLGHPKAYPHGKPSNQHRAHPGVNFNDRRDNSAKAAFGDSSTLTLFVFVVILVPLV